MPWTIAVRPKGKNPGSLKAGEKEGEQGTNEGGMVIELVSSSGGREEVTRVAWVRQNSIQPELPFGEALDQEMEKAKKSIEVLNELVAGAGELR